MRIESLLAALTILLSGIALRAQIVGRRAGRAQSWAGQQIADHRRPARLLRLLPCSALRLEHGSLEPEAHHADVHNLHQHHGEKQQHPAGARRGQQSMPELPRRHGGRWSDRCLRPGHDARVDVLGGCVRQQHAVVAPVQSGAAVERQYRSGRLAGGERQRPADPTGAVKLIKGNVECTSCHDPHVQAKDRFAELSGEG